MIKLRTMKQVASSRTIPSFRSCRTLNRADHGLIVDRGRVIAGQAQILAQDAHRQWRNGVWQRGGSEGTAMPPRLPASGQ